MRLFWKPAPDDETSNLTTAVSSKSRRRRQRLALLVTPSVVLAVLTLAIGLYPQALLSASQRAATELLDRSGYVQAVIGEPELSAQPTIGEDQP
jgi:multicomponent Na+:H+ antiporter subunit D